jgi:homogentisate 1,2-dioxygenase
MDHINPLMSHRVHLPPSAHTTFVANGFVVCSFLPRPLESDADALKVPFYHQNIDYDEVIFYHEGDFFSRDHMEKGSVTLHPRGINHGPHPKALMNQNSKKRTDEIAVMVDTVRSLRISAEAKNLELSDYWKSWTKKA